MPSGPERSFVDDTKLYISFLAHWANAVGDLNVDLLIFETGASNVVSSGILIKLSLLFMEVGIDNCLWKSPRYSISLF